MAVCLGLGSAKAARYCVMKSAKLVKGSGSVGSRNRLNIMVCFSAAHAAGRPVCINDIMNQTLFLSSRNSGPHIYM